MQCFQLRVAHAQHAHDSGEVCGNAFFVYGCHLVSLARSRGPRHHFGFLFPRHRQARA